MISSHQYRTINRGDLSNMFNVVGTFVLCAEDYKALREEHCSALYENEAEQ